MSETGEYPDEPDLPGCLAVIRWCVLTLFVLAGAAEIVEWVVG